MRADPRQPPKPFVLLDGKPLIAHVITRLAGQTDRLAINTNSADPAFAGLGLPLVSDGAYAGQGPLAGLLASLAWTEGVTGPDGWLLTAPADTPFLPADLAARLVAGAAGAGAPAGYAVVGDRDHPLIGVWAVRLRPALAAALAAGTRPVRDFAHAVGAWPVSWPPADADRFFNVNAPADIEKAARLCGALRLGNDPATPLGWPGQHNRDREEQS